MHVPQQLYSPSTDTIVAKQPQNVSTPLYMTHSAFVDGQLSARLGDDIKSDDDGEVSSLNRCLIDLHNFSSHHLSPIRPLSKIRRTTPRPVLPKPPPKTISTHPICLGHPSPTMASHLRLETRTFANRLVTAKSFFPLPSLPTIASLQRYPENWVTKSLFFKTEIQSFASKQAIRNGSHKTLHAGILSPYCPRCLVYWIVGTGAFVGDGS